VIDPLLLADLVIRLFVAIVLGAVIGLERQWRLRTAGIRTNALVAGGSALFVIVGAVGIEGATADPTRVAAQIVSGIGFLGAGVILRDGANIRGLTTAATLWCAAAIGSLAGAGMEEIAFIGAGAIVATNTLLRPLSAMVNRRMSGRQQDIATDDDSDTEEDEVAADFMLEVITADKSAQRVRALVLQAVATPGFTLTSLDVRAGRNSQTTTLLAGVTSAGGDTSGLESAVQRITLDPKVSSGRWWPVDPED
jgi:putative Mg2+ transporter-C (MgtC) family protein